LANLLYYIKFGGFSHNAKAISTTRIAGGLFVLLREQGLALTIKEAVGEMTASFCIVKIIS